VNTIQTTEFVYDETGRVTRRIVTIEETPSGNFLEIDYLTAAEISDLVTYRDTMRAGRPKGLPEESENRSVPSDCQLCGSVVHDSKTHDLWHALVRHGMGLS
jgi:hypothetical protein